MSDLSATSFGGKVNGKISYGISDSSIGVEMNGSGINSTDAINGAIGIKMLLLELLVLELNLLCKVLQTEK